MSDIVIMLDDFFFEDENHLTWSWAKLGFSGYFWWLQGIKLNDKLTLCLSYPIHLSIHQLFISSFVCSEYYKMSFEQ